MRSWLKILTLLIFFIAPIASWAQCAMCRTQLENNVSNGDVGIAAGINAGILYLLSLPYLAIIILGYVWVKNSRKNAKEIHPGPVAR
ncbi:MAG: hypothetical protein OEU76_03730 [Cyclobacteriaceae bacterium]|nr:hypothetical protein [Cyclobacteriaceae bacterium]